MEKEKIHDDIRLEIGTLILMTALNLLSQMLHQDKPRANSQR